MSRKIGHAAEEAAAAWLEGLGYEILERNYYAKRGEIDLVAQKDGVLHFVEVKYSDRADPLERITPAKLRRLLFAIERYLAQKRVDLPYQLDAVVVRPWGCELIENITF